MTNYLKKLKPLTLVLIFSIVLLNTACNKEEKGEQPELPPVASLKMDFTDFQTTPVGKGLEQKVDPYSNFGYAYNVLVFWNTLTIRAIIFPVAAYTTALQQEPEYLGNNTWEWSYTVSIEQQDWIVSLVGKRLNNDEFSMEMNIALSTAPLIKMKYLEGVCRYDHTEASWEIYEFDDLSTVKTIDVEWIKNFETEDASLKYTYVKPGEEETNHSITMVYDPDGEFDAGYYISKQDSDTEIEWNTTTKAGRVRYISTIDGFDWLCWNSYLQNISCPE